MASQLPLPIRIAAGVVAAGLDRLRRLPEDLPGLSVTIAGQAVRASMRIQQELAELANRGDELLSPIVDRPEEHPAWAHFDDADDAAGAVSDADPAPVGGQSPHGPVPEDYVTGGDPADEPTGGGDDVVPDAIAHDGSAGPAAMPGYDGLRAAQVRARLRGLSADDVAALLDYERSYRARAAFLTLLENRLATIRSGAQGAADRAVRESRHRAGHKDVSA